MKVREVRLFKNPNQSFVFYHLARAHQLNGDIKMAIDVYKKLIRSTTGRYSYNYLYAESFYQLGNLYKQLGEKEKALENYHKFIELWKDCDPSLKPLVDDARKKAKELAPDYLIQGNRPTEIK